MKINDVLDRRLRLRGAGGRAMPELQGDRNGRHQILRRVRRCRDRAAGTPAWPVRSSAPTAERALLQRRWRIRSPLPALQYLRSAVSHAISS